MTMITACAALQWLNLAENTWTTVGFLVLHDDNSVLWTGPEHHIEEGGSVRPVFDSELNEWLTIADGEAYLNALILYGGSLLERWLPAVPEEPAAPVPHPELPLA